MTKCSTVNVPEKKVVNVNLVKNLLLEKVNKQEICENGYEYCLHAILSILTILEIEVTKD